MTRHHNYYRSSCGDEAVPFLLLASILLLPVFLSDDTQADYLMDAMTAENAESAARAGMLRKLAPYFTACQQAANIPAGAQSGVTRAQAETAEACLFRAHENDTDRTGRISSPTQNHLEITNAETLETALRLGLFDHLGPYWEICRAQLGIDTETNPAETRADHETFEACLYTEYEHNLESSGNTPRP